MFLAAIFMLSTGVQAFAGTSLDNALNKVNLYTKGSQGAQLLTWKGVVDPQNFAATIIVYRAEDGKEYPAYCANPNKPGVENLAGKSYDVDADQKDTDPAVWGVITNGYPYKTPQELGVDTEYQAYYATKMAVWAVVHDNYSNLNDWKANGSQNANVEKAMKDLVAKGRANQYVYRTWLSMNPKSPKAETDSKDSNYLSQEYTLDCNVDIISYRVVIDGDVPAGAKVTDANNNEKDSFNGSEKTFKVLIPKESAGEGGSFRVLVKGSLENKAVLFGKSHANKQDYYIAPLPSYNGDSWVDLLYGDGGDTTPDQPGTPDNPGTPDVPKPSTDLQILKVAKGTQKGLAGAVFKVEVDAMTIGHYVTDSSGQITIENVSGTVSVTEEVPPEGYVLDENNHKDIEITDTKPIIITFANEEMAELEVAKVDQDTGEGLPGAALRVAYDGGHDSFDVYTNASGKAVLTGLKSGTYTVTEIAAPDGYILDKTPHSIKLEPGKKAAISIPNRAKPGLVIKKYDEDTVLPLGDAEFSVAKKGGSIVYEGVTDKSGQIRLEGLDPGWYTITELAPPKGYLIATESKDVYLEPNKCVEVKFDNRKRPSLQLMKIDSRTKEPLPNAKFKVVKTEDNTVSEYVTGDTGVVLINDLDEAIYSVEEISSPAGYCIDPDSHKDIALEWGKTKTLIFEDTKKPTLVVTKTNVLTEKPVPNTVFKIQRETENGGVVTLGTYKTDLKGQIILKDTDPGWYIITETRAAQGMSLPKNPVTRKYLAPGENAYLDDMQGAPPSKPETGNDTGEADNVQPPDNSGTANGGTPSKPAGNDIKVTYGGDYGIGEEIPNYPLNSIVIKKADANTSELLPGAVFEVRKVSEDISGNSGTIIGRYTVDNSGIVVITGLEPGGYLVEEVKPPTNYLLSENSQQQAWLKADGTSIVEVVFTNYPYGSILLSKVNALTNKPLPNARFKVTTSDGTAVGNSNGEFVSDENGEVLIPHVKPGSVIVTELEAPPGFVRDATPQTVKVGTDGGTYKVSFRNQPASTLVILKKDADSLEPLPNTQFRVTTSEGGVVGNSNGLFTTGSSGSITISGLEKSTLIIEEVKASDGYVLEEQSRTIAIDYGKTYTVEFTNRKKASLIIKKVDDVTGAPLADAKFLVEKQNGEHVGEYTTDKTGTILVPNALPGWYLVRETKAPANYILDETPKTVEVKTNVPTVVTFSNKALSGIKIIKTDSESGAPLPNVLFAVSKLNGEKIGNFKTGQDGMVYIPNLPDGYYAVVELEGLKGYHWDKEPKTVEVKSGRQTILEVKNTPASSLLIVKTDMETGKPLSDVSFDIAKQNGEKIGTFTTDQNGRIIVDLPEGKYTVVETAARESYELDAKVYEVEIKAGGQTVLRVQNKPLSGLRLKKIDAVTGEPIYNVEFMVLDINNKVVGTFYTDDRGLIDFSSILTEGRYTIRETRCQENYYPDNTPRTVEFVAGKVTEIIWKNQPKAGQIQVTKRSADDNEVNGLPAGTPLAGSIFEVYSYKSGNLVDRFITGSDGRGVSKPLPLGRYIVKEVQSPQYYQLNTQEMDVTIEFATHIIKLEFSNKSANTGVSIKKTGNAEAMPGDTIRYDIRTVRNTSTVPLTDFYWRDVLPTDAVRLNKIVTGTYNQSVKYKIIATTNKGKQLIIADNLSTTQNNVIDCSNASLGLYSDEYVTTFTLIFGNVKAGFISVEQPQVFVTVLKNLPGGYQFANKADIGGRYGNEWVVGNSTWLTTIYRATANRLPKTGY